MRSVSARVLAASIPLVVGCAPVDPEGLELGPVASHELAVHGPPHIQYLNFEGGPVHAGNSSDARTNTSGIPEEDSEVPPYAGGLAAMNAITGIVRGAYSPFNVVVTTERPPDDLEYAMTIIGGTNRIYCPEGCGALGVAPLDCADTNPYDVAFVFSRHFAGGDTSGIATATLQESAHAYGLGHTGDPRDYLYPSVTGWADRWATCTGPGICTRDSNCPDPFGLCPRGLCPVCRDDGSCCPRIVDDSSCGGEYQDTYETLMSMVGPAKADPFLPEVEFVSPIDLATVSSSFSIEIDATDRTDLEAWDPDGVVRIDLVIDGTVVDGDDAPPWGFEVADLSTAVHEIEAIAFDAEGNDGSAVITVRVLRDPECVTDADCASDERCSMGLCGPEPAPPEEPPPETPRRKVSACSVSGNATGMGTGAGLVVLALALVARRRR